MKSRSWMLFLLFVGLALASGCNKPPESTNGSGDEGAAAKTDGDGKHGHTHEGDDALMWQRADLEYEDYVISLGHHGKQLFAGQSSLGTVVRPQFIHKVLDMRLNSIH